jgi:hypothetical protein
MEHKPLAGVGLVADVHSAPLQPAMTPNQRLARWAEVLEREPTRELKSLEEIEGRSKAERRATRSDGSALAVAFEDAVLRTEGLASDRLGDASDFFGLSDGSAHDILCSCLHGHTLQAGEAAERVRRVVVRERAGLQGILLISGGVVGLLVLSGLSALLN